MNITPVNDFPELVYFDTPPSTVELPERFTNPFHYVPHPLCIQATTEVQSLIAGRQEWQEELALGKMFGVLVVRHTARAQAGMEPCIGYLAAFSGNLVGSNLHPGFVPPVYDLLHPDGFFKEEEARISAINKRIELLEVSPAYRICVEKLEQAQQQAAISLRQAKAELQVAKELREQIRLSLSSPSAAQMEELVRESQHQKASYKRLERAWKARLLELEAGAARFRSEIEQLKIERKERSALLQRRLFEQFRMLNARGEVKDLCTIFQETVQKVPPGGAGECALPKLLQYAYLHGLQPLAMAEFWWGGSPKREVRHHGYYYPSCKGKCEPILRHMLQGLEVDVSTAPDGRKYTDEPEIVYEDEWLLVVDKPAGMLSVPGKDMTQTSVYHYVRQRYPEATGPLVVHRLDMDTSGLLVVSKTQEVYRHLQAQFADRSIKKRYVALLEGCVAPVGTEGRISLPLCPNVLDRPRQMVNFEHGKEAVTEYRIVSTTDHSRVYFYPLTGRTHQLRVHAAHRQGLDAPILGDVLYGKAADRLYLHAASIEFLHPIYGKRISIERDPPF